MTNDDVVLEAQYDDAISSGGRTLVLHDGTVVLLSELSSAALRLAEGGITLTELGVRLRDEFGPPPEGTDAAQAARQVMEALKWHGLLTRRDPGEQGVA